MLISISIIILSGLFLGWICKKIHFPSLFGMIISGIIIGPYVLDLIDTSILDVSAEIRRIALIVILIRAGLGFFFVKWFSGNLLNETVMVIIVLSISFVLSTVEDKFKMIPFASLIAVMSIGIAIKKWNGELAVKLSWKYDKIWIVAEIFLFVLVGASVRIDSILSAGVHMIILIFGVLIFRMTGVFVCLLGTTDGISSCFFVLQNRC